MNYTNNSKAMEPQRGRPAATKWSTLWIVWLQDCLLSWAAARVSPFRPPGAKAPRRVNDRAPAILIGVWGADPAGQRAR